MITIRKDIEDLQSAVDSLQQQSSEQQTTPVVTFDGEKYMFGDKVFLFQGMETSLGDGTYMPILVDPESVEEAMQNPLASFVLNFNEPENDAEEVQE